MTNRIDRRGIRDDWTLELNGATLIIPGSQSLTDVLSAAARITGRKMTWNLWLRGSYNLTLEEKGGD